MSLKDFIKYEQNKNFNLRDETLSREINGIKIRDISFDDTLGDRVSAYMVVPPGEGPFPAIHFIHWLETHAEDSNRTQFLPHAIELAHNGYLSILPDAFWSTTPEKFNENPKLWWKTESEYDMQICKTQIIQLLRCQDILYQRHDVEKSRIGLVAHDFGAMYGSLLPSINNIYKCFVFIAATVRFSDWFRFGSKLSQEELEPYIEKMSFLDPITNIKAINNQPILFQFADDDFYVPKNVASEFFHAANEPKELRWYNAKHGMNDQSFQEMREWVMKQL